ncbi:hypothetical protein CupriaWKF_07295 [Cupriavidus sp. WKF15]|uniref:hypothetical protein n=1 Tax=Cupriavidus sp. WKF15 TaxID=3032282 RepID=UPI0023E1DE98|nr:hypothetical protein [Cupriavidus sp. WKF15]WER47343.1 hypothetical protein CupriaWKF_07295 [Cupriavidus sp. WKF15]
MKTSEYLRQIAAELSNIIEKNDVATSNESALRSLNQIHARIHLAWARNLIGRLLIKAELLYRDPPPDDAIAHSLLASMRAYIRGLREGAAAAEQRND